MSAWNRERSLAPGEGEQQPFSWAPALAESLRLTAARVAALRERPLAPATLESLRLWFRTQHVFHSNAIEGSTLTLYETQVVIGDGLTVGGKPLRDVLAAKNLAAALDWMEEQARPGEPLDERTVRQLHGLVMSGEPQSLPGQYKQENNLVTGAQFRPPSYLQTAPLMEALGRYLSGPMEADAVLSSAVAHAWLVGIHPFRDGNGRAARLLANSVLLRKGYPVALLTEDRRPQYYQALDKAHCTGDLTDFVDLWRECVETTLAEYERLRGDLQVRDREIEYLAAVVNRRAATHEGELSRWRSAIRALAGELEAAAEALGRRLETGQLRVSAPEVTGATIAQAKQGAVPVITLAADLPDGTNEVTLRLTDSSPVGLPGLTLDVGTTPRRVAPRSLARIDLDGARFRLLWASPGGLIREEETTTAVLAAKELLKTLVGSDGGA